MSIILYNLFLVVYQGAIWLYSLVDRKARTWVDGRRGWRQDVAARLLEAGGLRIWIHCASLGEFEQAAPVIEELKRQYPRYTLVLTFFSPSGYEMRKNYPLVDYVFYLPMDGPANAQTFVALVRPSLVLFVKYEFWYYYLRQLKAQHIPTVLLCAAFRPEQVFFKAYGGLFRKMLGYFDLVFLQDQASLTLLTQLGYGERAMVAGDTRYDRVAEIASGGHRMEQIASFQSNCHLIIGGSTWPEEEAILSKVLDSIPSDWKMIIAPHEIDPPHLARVNQAFGKEAVFFSEWKMDSLTDNRRVLIMDNMGMLSRLYRYGTIAFIGGGFRKGGIHNILEPAVFGLPVVFGPVYKKFVEATQLVSRDLAFSVRDAEEAKSLLNRLAGDEAWRSRIRESLKGFVNQQVGSTTLICAELLRRNWLMP